MFAYLPCIAHWKKMDWVTWDLSLALVLSKRNESVVVSMLSCFVDTLF